jgi:hypothetical protein
LREGQRLADMLPKPTAQRGPEWVLARARGEFAAKLARIDARAAQALAEGYRDPYNTWYKGGVALGLADRDPATSERILETLTNKNLRDRVVIRAAGRMARVDRERARRLADSVQERRGQALALGAMAQSLADTDRKTASALIEEAFRRLIRINDEVGNPPWFEPCVAAAHLLSVAERIDPELLRRGFWRAIAMRSPRPAGGDRYGANDETLARLAIGLARYDRAVARRVLEPAAARARTLVDLGRASRGHNLFAAAAVIDPAWAAALADSLPDDTPGASLHPKATVRRVIADVLAYDGPERWEHLDDYFLGFEPDSVDTEL